MNASNHQSAEAMQVRVRAGAVTPRAFSEALQAVSSPERDAWVDAVLGVDGVPEDGPALPRDGSPYLPCSVEAIVQVVEHARVKPEDVFVDLGSGVGRVGALVHLLTGASAIGVEIQPHLVTTSRALLAHLGLERVRVVEGDAAELTRRLAIGTVFFLYCPFSGERLERVLDGLTSLAQARQLSVCCVDLPLPERAWLTSAASADGVCVYRTTLARPEPDTQTL
jgi:predicted RNA methylase